MNRERVLKVTLVVVGSLFMAAVYPVVRALLQTDRSMNNEVMLMSLYATLGIFLLLAARDPSAHRSLIGFAVWSSFAHAAVMAVMAFQYRDERGELLIAVIVLSTIGAALLALTPGKP